MNWASDPFVRRMGVNEFWLEFDPRGMPWEDARAKRPLPEGIRRAKKSVSRVVLETVVNGERVFVKQSLPVSLRNRLSQHIVGSKSKREYDLATAFADAGVKTPDALMAADAKSGANYLVTRAAPDAWRPLDALLREEGLSQTVLDELAGFTAWLHALPAWHSDYRTDHVWWTAAPEKAPMAERFGLIDLDGGSIGRPVSSRRRRRSLRQLLLSLLRHGLTVEQFARFVELYDPRRQWRMDPARMHRKMTAIYERLRQEKIELRRSRGEL